jgi:triacylglycerol lipase
MKRGIMLSLVLFILLAGIIVVDLKGKISVEGRWNVWYTLLLMPHLLLLADIGKKYMTTATVIILVSYSFYCLIRLHIIPVLKDDSGKKRLKIMMGGRTILLYGITSLLLQCLAYAVLLPEIIKLKVSSSLIVIDAVITLVFVLLLLLNGTCRILFTSGRMRVVRRVVLLCTWWIPLANVIVILYCCSLVKQEYDHECYKVVNHRARVDNQICAAKYPLLMVHGIGFRDLKYLNYWGRIPKELLRNGAIIYYGHQEAWGTIEDNAADIRDKIFEILEETGCEKVNVIAHSKGGLDARYLIHEYNMEPYIASLTTISTPHRGSELLDLLCKMPDKTFRSIAGIIDKYFKKLGDKNPDCYTSSRQLSTAFAKEFNEKVTDAEGVYYQSYAIVMKNMFSDSLLCVPYAILKAVKGPNDGLVCVDSAKWGDFRGVLKNKYRRGISHGDIIDLKREDFRGVNVIEQYVKIAAELKEKGY